jgi:hypothetical protein
MRILFLAANPKQTTKLALDEEVRDIEQTLRATDARASIEMITKGAVRPRDLLQYLNEYRPDVVHFSGHGSEESELLLLDDSRRAKPVSARALRELFATLKDNVKVVVLNACFSLAQAEAITEEIDFAIGMNASIGDKAATVFGASFYRAIGFGRSVQDAFDQGKAGLSLEGLEENQTPQLIARQGADPSTTFLVRTDEGEAADASRSRTRRDGSSSQAKSETRAPPVEEAETKKPTPPPGRISQKGIGLRISDGVGPNLFLSAEEHKALKELLGAFGDHQQDCLFLLSSFAQGSLTTYTSPTGERLTYRGETISPEDASAAMMMACLVTKITTPDKLELRTTRDDFNEYSKNLVLIGSSITNKQTEWAHTHPDIHAPHVFDADPFLIRCQNPGCTLATRTWLPNNGVVLEGWQRGDRCRDDYAVVQRLQGPDESEENGLLVLAGLGPVGTQGAAFYLSRSWRAIHKEYGHKPFSIVLQFAPGKAKEPKFQVSKVVHRTDPADLNRCLDTPLRPVRDRR